MSESSESYHIRSSATDAVIAGIRKARLAGIALGPANGWITFVLFATCKRYVEAGLGNDFASRLTKAVGAPVLEYRYAEDFGWGFLFQKALPASFGATGLQQIQPSWGNSTSPN